MIKRSLAETGSLLYTVIKPLIFATSSAQTAHERLIQILPKFDASPIANTLAKQVYTATLIQQPTQVGGVSLAIPLMLAAGFVKGLGFESESQACAAVEQGTNIIPGWQFIPNLLGAVEFGSFTRYPRIGNPGEVIWRDVTSRSTQNRVGLKNPGARAAAYFLARHHAELPQTFGINIAVSPGVDDPELEQQEILDSLGIFLDAQSRPAWFTLNLSCPNTEDDPTGNQTEAKTRQLCQAAVDFIASRGVNIPLWVKIGPGLSAEQYHILMKVFAEVGIQAAIATNTIGQPAPTNPKLTAGVGGGSLHIAAVTATRHLHNAQSANDYPVDVIGCGGIMDGQSYHNFIGAGAKAGQYWSALIYRGPLAPAIIHSEAQHV